MAPWHPPWHPGTLPGTLAIRLYFAYLLSLYIFCNAILNVVLL